MSDDNGMDISDRIVNFFRSLLFDSWRDFLKAGVLAAMFFVWGNFLGLFVEKPRGFEFSRGLMGDFFEGYGYLTPAFQHFRDDTDERVPLLFEPAGLEDVRVCKDNLGYENTPNGFQYMKLIAASVPNCLSFERTMRDGTTIGLFSIPEAHGELTSVERGGEPRFFCGCSQQVITEYLDHPDLYPDPPKD